jgi:iron complex outermembrane receptor protein
VKKHFLLFIIAGLFIYPDVFSGDNDSVVFRNIPEVTVSRTRNAIFRDDKKILIFDSATLIRYQNANLGELLENNSPATINHYGSTGSIITVSFRGTGSNHSLISWNGFPLNSICSGEMDLSLASVDLADQVMVVSTATGAICGSGTFGGAIELNNYADWNNRIQIKFSSEFGSFNKKESENRLDINPGAIDSKKISLKIKTGTNRIQSSTSFYNRDALNKYPFINPESQEKNVYTQEHNKYEGIGILQSLSYKISNSQQVEAGVWWQNKDYELPLFSYKSAINNSAFKNQRDSSFKTYFKWQ